MRNRYETGENRFLLGGIDMYHEEYKTVKDTAAVKMSAKAFGKAILWAFGFTGVVFAALSLLFTYTPMSEALIPFVVILTAVLSVIIAGVTASRSAKSRGWLNGSAAGILYSVILYLFSSLAGNGFYFNSYILVMALVSLFAGAVGGILGINLPDKRKR